MVVLRSYVSGSWFTPADEGVARARRGDRRRGRPGLVGRRRLRAPRSDYGRTVGGPALRELTFHQRAALAEGARRTMLREHRDELYALSARTGATLADSKFDIDGGIGVLLGYASKARRELPNDTGLRRGPGRAAGQGRHVRRPAHPDPAARRRGADQRVQLPGLGPAGEARAGVHRGRAHPDQAGQPDRLPDRAAGRADRRVRAAARGLGAAGLRQRRRPARPPDEQDLLAFTGSAATAQRLRAHPVVVGALRAVQRRGRLAQLLDPRPGRRRRAPPEFDLLRRAAGHRDDRQGRAEVHRDPPRVRAGRARSTRSPRPSARGWPRSSSATRPTRAVRMGALASLEQREEVRRSLKALPTRAARLRRPGARRGGRRRRRARRVPLAAPAALRRRRPRRAARGRGVRPGRDADRLRDGRAGHRAGRARPGQPGRLGRHRRRATSPATVVLGVGALARPAARARPRRRRRVHRARLAAARCSCTAARAAPAAARRWAASAACCTTCSAPRCRPSPRAARRVTGRWVAGAPRTHRGRPPVPQVAGRAADRRHAWSPARARSRSRTSSTSPSSPATRSTRTWTRRPRPANPFFDGRVAHGYLIVSFAAGLFVHPDPGPVLANYGLENLRFLTPVYPGDELTVTLTCKQISPREGELRRGALGRGRHQAGRRRSRRPTTC